VIHHGHARRYTLADHRAGSQRAVGVNIRNFNLAMINPIFTRGEKAAGMSRWISRRLKAITRVGWQSIRF
ncbi:hypothetical protein O5343_27500, partial [Escherichia coli]|nr:hypothetical protein [Escherichia coli]